MSVNNSEFKQASTILNQLYTQVTGGGPIEMSDLGDFVSVATITRNASYDTLMTAITQLVTRTIFSIRPYNALFSGIDMDAQRWGAAVRKLSQVEKPIEDDEKWNIVNNGTVDHYKIRKPETLQLNFYGGNSYQKAVTYYLTQLDQSFDGPGQLNSYMAMQAQTALDQITQVHETEKRACVLNMIAGLIVQRNNSPQVVHLVTEYKDKYGQSGATAENIYQDQYFSEFVRFMYARIMNVADMMRERSTIFHQNVTGKPIMRHTPKNRLKAIFNSMTFREIRASVFPTLFSTTDLKMVNYMPTSYWQSIDTPYGINITPSIMASDGTITKPSAPVVQSGVLGMIFDEEALGMTTIVRRDLSTPINAAGEYFNQFFHFTDRWYNDYTENAVVFLLD